MKKLLLAVALAALVPAAAGAADLPGSLKETPAVFAASGNVNWTGAYAGGHVGGAWSQNDLGGTKGTTNPTDYLANFDVNDTAIFGGGQLGYNIQRGTLVFGVEGDIGWMGIGKSVTGTLNGSGANAKLDNNFYGDLTARLGVAADRWLIYAKGGVAFLDTKLTVDQGNDSASSSDTMFGWVLGGGVEYALSKSWSLKAEYLHFDFDRISASGTFGSDTVAITNEPTLDTIKVGVNYRF